MLKKKKKLLLPGNAPVYVPVYAVNIFVAQYSHYTENSF
jgi:hypothetical protein